MSKATCNAIFPGKNTLCLVVAAVYVLSFLISGCGTIKDVVAKITGQAERSTVRTVNILDDAIAMIDKNSQDWQAVLAETRDKLIKEGQTTIANEVSNTLNRTIAVTGSEFRCDTDFLRHRVKEDLIALKAHFLGQDTPPKTPALCNVVPSSIDMSLEAERRNRIDIFGYNFDTSPDPRLLLEDETGNMQDVSSALARPTFYQMTVDLGGSGVHLDRASRVLHLRWAEQELSSIKVVQPSKPVCEKRSVDPTPEAITLVPDHDGGDTNFGGGSTAVDVEVTVDRWFSPTGVGASALVKVNFMEIAGDHTSASAFKMFNLYTPDPGFDVDKIILAKNTTDYHYVHTDTPSDLDSFETGGDGPVNRIVVEGLNNGDNGAGGRSRVTITFNPLRMILVQHGDCTPPQ